MEPPASIDRGRIRCRWSSLLFDLVTEAPRAAAPILRSVRISESSDRRQVARVAVPYELHHDDGEVVVVRRRAGEAPQGCQHAADHLLGIFGAMRRDGFGQPVAAEEIPFFIA